MPLALNKIKTFKFASLVELLLYILENATEEHFWKGIFGDRLTRLLQRYFGNDFFMIGILFYLAPILKSRWEKVVDVVMARFRKPTSTVSVRVYYYDEVFKAINYYVMKHTEQLPGMIDAVVMYEDKKPKPDNGPSNSDENDEKPKVGLYPRCNTSNIFNYKNHYLWVSSCVEDEEKVNSSRPNHLDITLTTKPGESIDTLKAIIQEWCDDYNDAEDNSIKILRWSYDEWVYKDSLKPRDYDSVNLPPGVKENLLGDMQRFIKRRSWYQRKGLPHRRGFLLYGPPGTGKTSLIQALAGQLKYNLALIKLGEVNSDSEFADMIQGVPKETLLIIEDLDHYDEDNSDMEVSKSGLLNGLDGINGNDGAMVFMTCNDMNKITPALLRPGRMDVKLELGYAVHAQVKDMFWRFFGTSDDDDDDEDEDDDNVSTTSTTSSSIHDLPTPPNEKLLADDTDDKERMDYLNGCLDRLLAMIPEHHVTTSELQNLFVTLFLEVGPNQITEKELLDRLFTRVPEFLERVKLDREQAKLHDKLDKIKKGNNSDSDSDSDSESETNDDADTTKDDTEIKEEPEVAAVV